MLHRPGTLRRQRYVGMNATRWSDRRSAHMGRYILGAGWLIHVRFLVAAGRAAKAQIIDTSALTWRERTFGPTRRERRRRCLFFSGICHSRCFPGLVIWCSRNSRLERRSSRSGSSAPLTMSVRLVCKEFSEPERCAQGYRGSGDFSWRNAARPRVIRCRTDPDNRLEQSATPIAEDYHL